MLSFLGEALGSRRSLAATALPLAVGAAWLVWADPDDLDLAVAIALFAQMFAAATGYREQAHRGHFDPVLTLGSSRARVAAGHALLSIAPGAVAWALVTAAVWIARPGAWPSSLTLPGIAAFAYVSCAAWACALPLTRYASGVVWSIALFILAGVGRIGSLRADFLMAGSGWMAMLSKTGAALVCPFFLVSDPLMAGPRVLCFVVVFGGLLAAWGVRFIVRLDIPLKEPS
jgi:hypothetical protein